MTSPQMDQPKRLVSLDVFRGVIMLLLILGETDIFSKLYHNYNNSITAFLSSQFSHSKWRGLHLWDLLLPSFMLIAGTAMAFSFKKDLNLKTPSKDSFKKVAKRCFLLLFWGILIYAVRNQHLNLQFSNVLVELSFATLICFSIRKWNPVWQLAFSFVLLLTNEMLLRFTHIPGFDQPFTDQHNFANYLDLLLIKKVNKGYGTTLNIIPSAAHTIWGLMAGQFLMTTKNQTAKFKILLLAGVLLSVSGFLLDWFNITPILKWIASTSFILATGGISLITLALFYYWIDMKKNQRNIFFFTVVGMNSIFIYLFFTFIGAHWMNGYLNTLCVGLFDLLSIPIAMATVGSCLLVFAIEWWICYFLYKKGIFFRL
jgi:predicted acyltransferase